MRFRHTCSGTSAMPSCRGSADAATQPRPCGRSWSRRAMRGFGGSRSRLIPTIGPHSASSSAMAADMSIASSMNTLAPSRTFVMLSI